MVEATGVEGVERATPGGNERLSWLVNMQRRQPLLVSGTPYNPMNFIAVLVILLILYVVVV